MAADRDRDGRTALHIAVFEGRTEDVARLLGDGVDPDAADNGGRVPLHFVAQEYRKAEVTLLCEAGASVDARDSYGNTPLWRAVFDSQGRSELIQILLANGADPDAKNDSGVSPRELAERFENRDALRLFRS